MGLVLDMSRSLEEVIYFASYVVVVGPTPWKKSFCPRRGRNYREKYENTFTAMMGARPSNGSLEIDLTKK